MPISFGMLSLVDLYMTEALSSASYLYDRDSVLKVGNFPWILSKYGGSAIAMRLFSFIARFVITLKVLS